MDKKIELVKDLGYGEFKTIIDNETLKVILKHDFVINRKNQKSKKGIYNLNIILSNDSSIYIDTVTFDESEFDESEEYDINVAMIDEIYDASYDCVERFGNIFNIDVKNELDYICTFARSNR